MQETFIIFFFRSAKEIPDNFLDPIVMSRVNFLCFQVFICTNIIIIDTTESDP